MRDRLDPLEVVAVIARWFVIAALLWFALLPRYGPALPELVGVVLSWFSWLALTGGTFTLLMIALLRPELRWHLVRTIVVLGLLFAIVFFF